MPGPDESTVPYARCRFSTQLPLASRYSPWHFWAQDRGSGIWRVGFTSFAVRLLGEMVEHAFDTPPGSPLAPGAVLGWAEGFKAVSDIYSLIQGRLIAPNPALQLEPVLVNRDPFGRGWLYEAQGNLSEDCVDAPGYVRMLDRTIDEMLGEYVSPEEEARAAENDAGPPTPGA